jgi:hypothetical protein
MEYIFNLLPVIYVYWAGILAVWSLINGGMMFKIIASACIQSYTKQSYLILLITVLIGGGLLVTSVFMIPQVTVLFIEIACMLALWYTVFLITVSHLNIVAYLHFPVR